MNLGTEQHKKLYFEDIDKYRLPGNSLLPICYRYASAIPYCRQKAVKATSELLDSAIAE